MQMLEKIETFALLKWIVQAMQIRKEQIPVFKFKWTIL